MEPYLFRLFTLSKIVLAVAVDVLFTHLFVICASEVQVLKAAFVARPFFPVIYFALCAKPLAPEAHDAVAVYGPTAVDAVV
jgi:hypothetical protein